MDRGLSNCRNSDAYPEVILRDPEKARGNVAEKKLREPRPETRPENAAPKRPGMYHT